MRAAQRCGVLAAGHFIVDRIVMIDRYPPENTLATIDAETRASGGCPYTVLKDLAILGAAFPLAGLGALGDDGDARWVLDDCSRHGIDVTRMIRVADEPTSYTYAMTARDTGRRTFFHRRGANARLAAEHFDLQATDARIFVLGYLTLLDALDRWLRPGMTAAAEVLRTAATAGMTTVVDLVSAPHPEYAAIVRSALPYIDHLLLNELEAAAALRHPVEPTAAGLLGAAHELAAAGVRASVAIHCESGAVVYDARDTTHAAEGSVALPAALIAGATGAGDAFTAGYVLALHADAEPAQRLHTAICCAAACLRDPSASDGLAPLAACLELGEQYGRRAFG